MNRRPQNNPPPSPTKRLFRCLTFVLASITFGVVAGVGCSSYRPFSTREFSWQLNAPTSHNPIFVSSCDHEFLWSVLVDVIDSHFEISREMPVRLYDHVLTEGRLDTKPKIGASIAEPWHADSVGIRERIDCTLQTIQRRAIARVIPEANGYLIELFVYKELEDNKNPLKSSSSAANLRFVDDVDEFTDRIDIETGTAGWIMIGRDTGMEDRLLLEIAYRLQNPSGVLRKSKAPIRG